jgi:16S rRNA (guanine966-N2)-methyltransferase
MSDKGRGALFNILGDVDGLKVFDPFAGSGALSFEAISRGAASALMTEVDKAAQRVIVRNIARLGFETQAQLVKASANSWLATNSSITFDLVLCDPPYNDLQPNLIKKLAQVVGEEGILVLSWPSSSVVPEIDGLKIVKERPYGDLTLVFYAKIR